MFVNRFFRLASLSALGTGLAISAGAAETAAQADLPPNAVAGECYARVFVPPVYESASEQVLRAEASQRIDIVPARYGWSEEEVLVQEASTRLVEVPAVYETISDVIEVEPARTVWRARQKGKAWIADGGFVTAAQRLGVPADAPLDQCFAEQMIPARFETREERVLKSEPAEHIEIVPARYEWSEERVLVKEASTRIVEVPAVYKTVSEQVLVKPAHQVWKEGRGPIERVDHATGEIMCLVDVPAQYETVSRRVLVTPATTRQETVPAEYKMVKVRKVQHPAEQRRVETPAEYTTVTKRIQVSDGSRSWIPVGSPADGELTGLQLCRVQQPAVTRTVHKRVLRSPATTKEIAVPAKYETVKVRKLIHPASEKRIEIPAQYASVTKRNLVRDGRMSWRPVLCETNATPALVSSIQRALKSSGHDPGPIDGVFGSQTLAAIRSFQQKKGLPTGGVTVATLDALGIDAGMRSASTPDVAAGPAAR